MTESAKEKSLSGCDAKQDIEVRDATEKELQNMLELTIGAYKEYQADSPDGFWDQYIINIGKAVTEASETERVGAFINGEMIGSVLLCRRSMRGDHPEIRLLAVSPSARNKGIARLLMKECESRLVERGHEKVVLHTTDLMNTARAMYERSGYTRFEAEDFSPVPGFTVMGYIKSLNSADASEARTGSNLG